MARTLTCPRCGLTFEDVRGDGQHGIHGERVRFGPDPEDVCTHLTYDPTDCWDCFADRLHNVTDLESHGEQLGA